MDDLEATIDKASQWIDGWEAARAGDPSPLSHDTPFAVGYRAFMGDFNAVTQPLS